MSSQSPRRQSLDEVFAEIQHNTAQQLWQEVQKPLADPAMDAVTARMLASAGPSEPQGGSAYSSELMSSSASEILFGKNNQPLSARQRALPRLQLGKMVGGLVAVLFLVVGVSSGTYLTQQSQDVRQQAYDGKSAGIKVSPAPSAELPSEMAVVTGEEPEISEPGVSSRMMIGLGFIGAAVLLLVGLFFWLFAV